MRCEEVQELLNALIDEHLNPHEKEQVLDHLHTCNSCAKGYNDLRRFVEFCRQIESPEPKIDLWREIEPKLAEVIAEQRLPFALRLRRQWDRLISQVCYGVILFLQVVTYQVTLSLSRYVVEADRPVYGRSAQGG